MTAAKADVVPLPLHLLHSAVLVRTAYQTHRSMTTFCDMEAGTGDFLAYLKSRVGGHPGRRGGRILSDMWGYTVDPRNVLIARARGLAVSEADYVARPEMIAWGDCVSFVEALEYLSDPEAVLGRLAASASAVTTTLVASSEVAGKLARHSWEPEEYSRMLKSAGWRVEAYRTTDTHVTVLAERAR